MKQVDGNKTAPNPNQYIFSNLVSLSAQCRFLDVPWIPDMMNIWAHRI